MKTNSLLWGALALALFASCDKDDDNDINQQDRDFTMRASMANFAEVDAGQLAVTKGSTPGIRQFGQMMVMDHTNSKAELKSIAVYLGLYAPDSLDAEQVALKNQLMSLSGRAFDSVYIHAQVRDHNMAIDLYEDEEGSSGSDRLQRYAHRTLPHLREHKHKADSIAALY
jgi:putative membrane protein